MSDVDRTHVVADDPTVQPSGGAVAGAPLPPTPRSTRSRSGWRAVVAALATAFLLVATLGVAVFAQTGRGAEGPTFLPATAVLYAEARLDLPGDQRDQLISLLGHLPGFADPASFDTKLNEALDQVLGQANAPISWSQDVKSWFDGQLMFGLPTLPPMSDMSSSSATSAAAAQSVIFGLGVTDRAALDASLTKLLGSQSGLQTEEYGGTTITSMTNGSGTVTALAPTDTVLLFGGSVDVVKSALDVLGGTTPSLAEDADYQAAIKTVPADHLGAFYVDTAQLKDVLGPMLQAQLQSSPQLSAQAGQITAALALLPPSLTGYIRAETDHLLARIDAPVIDGAPTLAVRSTDLASKVPADSILYLETRDLGVAIKTIVNQLKPMLAAQGNDQALAQIEALLGTGLDSYLDWVGDVGISASLGTATGPSVGLVATVSDAAIGQKRIDSLLTLIRAVSATADPSPVEISSEDVNGVTVTSITLTDSATASMGSLPVEPRISIAIDDTHFYLGLGDFAKNALTQDPATSLASAPGYTKAVAATGDDAGHVYVNVASVLGFAELMMSSDQRDMFETQLKPYADALDSVMASIGQDGTSTNASLMLFLK
ncbi:MAG: DUF3352 domain-containing protein [Chloroflexota bacterium]